MTKFSNLLCFLSLHAVYGDAFNIPHDRQALDEVVADSANTKERSKYVNLAFTKSYGDNFESSESGSKPQLNLNKREDGYESIEISNQITFYSVNLDIGTPSQNLTVLVDTGSSDLWVTGSDNPYCSSNSGSGSSISSSNTIDCSEYGTFDSDSSSTWSSNDTSFSITYGDSTFASGVWGQDRLHLEDLNVTGLSFAVANETNSTVAVLGIGLPGLEVTYAASGSAKSYQYDNFPLVLKRNGAIESNVYSLYLNELDADYGSVLFGAVDHMKYDSPLYTIPIINTLRSSGFTTAVQFDVTLQGLGMTFNNGATEKTLTTTKIPALLDSGTTLTYLPTSLLTPIANYIGATYSSRLGYYTLPCPSSSSSNETVLVFDFGGFYINATLDNFLIQASSTTCLLGILPQSGNSALLGDSFLTSAYVVYDLENKEISMAQANYDTNDTNIEVVTAGATAIPSATKAPGYSSTWSTTVTSIGTTGDIFTLSGSTDATNSTSSASRSTKTSSSTKNDAARLHDVNQAAFFPLLVYCISMAI